MKNEKIIALRVALLIAISEAEKVKNSEDSGTSNMDTPTLYLENWKLSEIEEAFKLTGLIPHTNGSGCTFILRACEGQGYRRTAMAEAFSKSLRASGYIAGVDYRMD